MDKEKLRNIPEYDLGDYLLRAIQYEDHKDMFEYGSDDEVTKTLVWSSYKRIEDAIHSVKNVFLSRPERGLPMAHAIIDKKKNKMIGTCDFHSVDFEKKTGEIGYALNREYWGKGIMTKACLKVMEFGYDYLGLDKIIIKHYKENIGSQRVIEKCGFIKVKDTYSNYKEMFIPSYELTKEQFYKKQ